MRKIKIPFLQTLSVFLILLFWAGAAAAQTSVSGRITDTTGAGLAGITVTVKGTKIATSTGAGGNFTVNVPAGSKTLVVSAVGYATQEIAIVGKTSYDVTMLTTVSSLNEVVVTGYGTSRKKDVTGAAAIVGSKDFQKGAFATADQLILGKVPGVSIISNGGTPGAGSTIRIRGGASLAASNNPLLVIDGLIINGGGIAGSPNPLSLLNPNDIESFTILKDASASAIYGSRASNGVILITTKKGKSGKPQISFNTSLSLGTLSRKIPVLSADQFRDFVNEHGTPAQIAQMGVATTDWQDEIYQNAFGVDNNLSVSGVMKGKVKMPYRASLGNYYQQGVLSTGDLNRFTGTLNLNPSFFTNHLNVNLNLKGSTSANKFANAGAIGGAVSFDPTKPVKTGYYRYSGYYEWLDPNATTGLKALAPANPVALLTQTENTSRVNASIGNLQLDYKFHFLPELRINVNGGYDISEGNGTTVTNDSTRSTYMRNVDANNKLNGGQNTQYRQQIKNYVFETYINYTKDIKGINSRVDATAGYGYYDNLYINYFYADYFYDHSMVKNSTPSFAVDSPRNRLISYYGRLNYSYKSKYLLTATIRDDGSSRLNPDNRWLVYWSGALAWRMSDENFLKNSKTISDLKLRVSYGITGQQDGISDYSYLANYGISNQTAQYQLGGNFLNLYRPNAYNAYLTWEQTATTNIGLDYGLFKNRITGSLDFYLKQTTDLLNNVGQSAGTNFAPIALANVGDMENRGVEFLINAGIVRKKDWTLDFGFNATYNENKITKLTFDEDPNYEGQRYGNRSGGTGGTILINSVGYNRGAFYVYKQVYDAAGVPIDNMFEDLNRDGVITEEDLYRYKSANPDVFLGFNANVTYKRWNAGFIARASFGNYMYNNVESATGTYRNIFNPIGVLNNGSTNVLVTNFSGNGDKYYSSDYYVQNASYFRMDNINIGYDFGKVFNNKADMRASFIVQNAFTITDYTGADAANPSGIDNNFYAPPTTFIASFSFNF